MSVLLAVCLLIFASSVPAEKIIDRWLLSSISKFSCKVFLIVQVTLFPTLWDFLKVVFCFSFHLISIRVFYFCIASGVKLRFTTVFIVTYLIWV